MADPFVAEIRIFPFNFAPKGWASCDGQILPISQNTALFSLLGTTYGGDGKSTFALPNLNGREAIHPGQGPGLSLIDLGQSGGSDTVTLLESEMPLHSHEVRVVNALGDKDTPAEGIPAQSSIRSSAYAQTIDGSFMAPTAVAMAGGALPHNNMPPYLALGFYIALQGVFPPRT